MSSQSARLLFIEVWARAPGLLTEPTQIRLLGDMCNVSLHFVQDRSLRLAVTSLDQ